MPFKEQQYSVFPFYRSLKVILFSSSLLKGSGDVRSGSVCISSTFTALLTYDLDYSSILLSGQGIKLKTVSADCTLWQLGLESAGRVLVLDAMYGYKDCMKMQPKE